MSARLELTLPFPPSANDYWRSAPRKGLVPSTKATAYKANVQRAAIGIRPLVGPVRVTLTAFRPRRVGDLDNVLKVLFDACREIAFLDDAQVEFITAERKDDANNPRVELVCEGERFATREEVTAAREKRVEAAKKRRKTLRENALNRRITPSLFGRRR